MDKIICIAGPTASGKTALAVSLAKKLNAEIVSCDSMQVYRRMNIGTAKPTAEEMQGVRHHLLDVAEPTEDFSVSRYVELADAAVQEILARRKPVIIAGGTGLYMDSLIAGRQFACPATGQRQILERYADKNGIEAVYSMLADADPDAAERLHLGDRKRIIRAMEVFLETGMTITEHNERTKKQPAKYEPVFIGLDFASRETLYARIDARVDDMMAQGLEREVRALLHENVPQGATAMQAIGYRQLVEALQDGGSIDAAVEDIKRESRRYAKRQLTWFRRNREMHWLVREDCEDIFSGAVKILRDLSVFDI